MDALPLNPTRNQVLWRALWKEMEALENHPDNRKYRTGREAVLAEMRAIRDMLREIQAREAIVSAATLEEMLAAHMFESPFTVA